MNSLLERKEERLSQRADIPYPLRPDQLHPPGPPVRKRQAPPEDAPRRRGVLGWLKALLGGLAAVLLIDWKHTCPRCRSQAIAMVNTVETSGPGWWSLSFVYRCNACDWAWERAPLWSEDPYLWG